MDKFLIINLKRLGDIYSTHHLIDLIKRENPHAEISLLVYNEFERATKTIPNIQNVFSIDRKKLLTFKNNKIYNDAFALNLFLESMKEIRETKWKNIITHSNDLITTYLASSLNSENILGTSRDENNNLVFFNDWSMTLNEVITSSFNSPFTYIDMQKLIFSPQADHQTSTTLMSNSKHDNAVKENFSKLKEDGAKSIVGIQLKTSTESKDIPENLILDTIEDLLSMNLYTPVILIAPIEEEIKYAQKINSAFNNSIVVIEADLLAINSVIKELDLLITPDSAIKHIADIYKIPTIEISLGNSPLFKQGSISTDTVILTNSVEHRSFKDTVEQCQIRSSDIIKSVIYLSSEHKEQFSTTAFVTAYKSMRDDCGTFYTPINDDYNAHIELNRISSRIILKKFFSEKNNDLLYKQILSEKKTTIAKWLEVEKKSVSTAIIDLLGTIRSLVVTKENPKSMNSFVQHIEKIFSYCDNINLTKIPALIFRSKIENLPPQSFVHNYDIIDSLLYDFKNQLQIIMQTTQELEKRITLVGANKIKSPRRELND